MKLNPALAFHSVVVFVVVLLVAGCSGSGEGGGTGGSGASTGSNGTGGSGTGTGGSGTGTGGSATGTGGSATGTGGSATGTGGGLAGFEEPCTISADCDPSLYCDSPYGSCDTTLGICLPRMTAQCTTNAPACGCDGTIYASECEARLAGVSMALSGCATPAQRFPCGWLFCDPTSSYCWEGLGDTTVGSPPNQYNEVYYQCRSLPAACGATPSCACLPVNSQSSCSTVTGEGVVGLKISEVLI